MKIYRSKIGAGVVIPLAVVLIIVTVLMLYKNALPGLGIILILIAFITHMFLTTHYTISEDILKIKCGFLYNMSINISDIKKIEESRIGISSPAASFDRIEITFNKFDTVLISPKNKIELIEHLLSINPSILVYLKDQSKKA